MTNRNKLPEIQIEIIQYDMIIGLYTWNESKEKLSQN